VGHTRSINSASIMRDDDLSLWHDLHHSLALIAVLAAAVGLEESLSDTSRHRLELMRHEMRCLEEMARSIAPSAPHRRTIGAPLHTVLRETVAVLDEVYPADLYLDAEALEVALDVPGARRLASNLLENALVAVGRGGKVAVELRREGCEAVFVVADSGPGFGPTGSPVEGCGLSTVRTILARSGGAIAFGRSSLGGAEVTVWLPLC
jgi:signal transduction histidine kinase